MSYVRPTTSAASSLYRCVTIQMEDEVRTLLLQLAAAAAAVSQLVSRRRVADNGTAMMR